MASYPPPPNERMNQTPTPSHIQVPTFPPSSSNDFSSPSAFLNPDAYASNSGESTPHYDFDHSTSSSMSMPSGGGGDEMYEFSYADFQGMIPPDPADQPTPSARQDDQTPVVPEGQAQIPPTTYPAQSVRVKDEDKPLLSPFRSDLHEHQPNLNYSMPMPQQQYIDPSTQPIYFQTPGHQHLVQTPYYEHSPAQAPVMIDSYQQQYYAAPQHMTYFAGPTRSQHGSPSSVGSSGGSLPRSASTSTEFRHRAKVKLTYEDKRNIVELHRSNSSLRQEDIARQYGVDRSTISKIILAQHRWTQPPEQHAPPQPKVCKAVGGRFPAIETMMHEWMDEQIAAGHDVRDNIAREKAKEFAKRIGFPMDRFKASAKWLDKFKERRKELGKPNSPMISYGPYAYSVVHPDQSLMYAPSMMISRSQSAATFSSSDSSQDMYQPSPNSMTTSMTQNSMYVPTPEIITPNRMGHSESDLLRIDTTPATRARSQSSPQLLHGPGTQSPSSGKAKVARPSPLSLQRQNSYHGTSPSPRRPALLTRSNTAQVPVSRRTRPTSLAASAFGITPIVGDEQLPFSPSPLASPATSIGTSLSSIGTHSRRRSDVSLAPFTSSMGGMTISPDMSDGDHGSMAMAMGIPPLTPMTPGHSTASFPSSGEYAEMPMPEYTVQPTIQPGQLHQSYDKQYTQHQYSTPVYNQEMPQYVSQPTDQVTWQ